MSLSCSALSASKPDPTQPRSSRLLRTYDFIITWNLSHNFARKPFFPSDIIVAVIICRQLTSKQCCSNMLTRNRTSLQPPSHLRACCGREHARHQWRQTRNESSVKITPSRNRNHQLQQNHRRSVGCQASMRLHPSTNTLALLPTFSLRT
jgi:hypothetical protein